MKILIVPPAIASHDFWAKVLVSKNTRWTIGWFENPLHCAQICYSEWRKNKQPTHYRSAAYACAWAICRVLIQLSAVMSIVGCFPLYTALFISTSVMLRSDQYRKFPSLRTHWSSPFRIAMTVILFPLTMFTFPLVALQCSLTGKYMGHKNVEVSIPDVSHIQKPHELRLENGHDEEESQAPVVACQLTPAKFEK